MTTALVPIPQSSVTNAPPGSRPAADPTPVATVAVAKNASAAVAGAVPSRRAVRLFLPGDVVPPNLRDFACALRRSPRAPKPKPARGGAAIVGWSTTAAAAPVTATARPELTSSCEAPCGDDACTAAVAQCEALLECRAVVVRPQQSPPPSRHGASGRGGIRDGNPGGSRGGQSFNASAPGAVARLAAVLKASSLADDSLALLATSRWWGSPALGLPPPPALSASRSGARSARSSNGGGGGGGGAAASSAATGAAGLGVGEARSRLYIAASYGGCGSKMVAAWLKALPKEYQKCVAHFPMYPWCLFGLQLPVCVCFAPLRIARYVFHVHDRSPPRNLWRMPVPKVLGSRLSGVAHQRPPPSGNPPRRPKAGVHGGAGDARASSFKGDATFKRDGDLVRRSSGHRREKSRRCLRAEGERRELLKTDRADNMLAVPLLRGCVLVRVPCVCTSYVTCTARTRAWAWLRWLRRTWTGIVWCSCLRTQLRRSRAVTTATTAYTSRLCTLVGGGGKRDEAIHRARLAASSSSSRGGVLRVLCRCCQLPPLPADATVAAVPHVFPAGRLRLRLGAGGQRRYRNRRR